jgi:hypothetical protein
MDTNLQLWNPMRLLPLCLLLSAVTFAAVAITNEDIIRMVQQGIAPATILASIKGAESNAFHITPEEQPALVAAGVPPAIIEAMVRRMMLDESRSNIRGENEKPREPANAKPARRTRSTGPTPAPAATDETPISTLAVNRSFSGVSLLGDKGATHGKLVLGASDIEFAPSLRIPLSSVRTLIYERSSKPRYAAGLLIAWPLLFTKSKQHYLTVQHATGYGVFQLPKGSYMEVLAAMEAATGKHVERHEER